MKISEIRKQYPAISLKRICDELGLCYQYVLKASKQPIEGEKYDAEFFNEEAVEKIVAKKNAKPDEINWEAIANEVKQSAPVSKPEEFTVGTKFKLRETKEHKEQGISPVYSVAYITETHCVFVSELDTQPRVMNWDTFLHQSPRVQK